GCGVRVAMTSPDHASGTDRLAECARIAGWSDDTIVVNLQGDEPFAPASGLQAAARALADSGAEMATLATPIEDAATLFDPNAVKLVRADDGTALYFSRAPIPWPRDAFATDRNVLPQGAHWLRHIGLYAYRTGFLKRFAALPPGRLERIESLEQLRVLEAGFRIAVAISPEPFPPGVDTPEDLARAQKHWETTTAGR
ncbi:MAG: 3-deoxy-manno-octulosonate cytidylyltransferase, partial [Lysobacter sp.]|nr:3-deoxy-manno-octulosonate cytidylyltransferase [Lysobacter sp.]